MKNATFGCVSNENKIQMILNTSSGNFLLLQVRLRWLNILSNSLGMYSLTWSVYIMSTWNRIKPGTFSWQFGLMGTALYSPTKLLYIKPS